MAYNDDGRDGCGCLGLLFGFGLLSMLGGGHNHGGHHHGGHVDGGPPWDDLPPPEFLEDGAEWDWYENEDFLG